MAANKRFRDSQRYLVEGKTLNELFEAIQTATLLKGPGYDLSVDPGNGTRLKIKVGAAGDQSWGLIGGGTKYKIAVGRVYTSYEDINGHLTIASSDLEFAPTADRHVYLELTNLSAPVITLKYGTNWTDHPKLYQLTDLETTPRVEKAIFPLWSFIAGTIPDHERGYQIHPDYYARQYQRQNDLIIAIGSYELNDTFRHVPVPVLAPF